MEADAQRKKAWSAETGAKHGGRLAVETSRGPAGAATTLSDEVRLQELDGGQLEQREGGGRHRTEDASGREEVLRCPDTSTT